MSFLGNNVTGLISNSHAVGSTHPLDLHYKDELLQAATDTSKTVDRRDKEPPSKISMYLAGQNKTLVMAIGLVVLYVIIKS